MSFAKLPTELQINVLSQINCPLGISQRVDSLTHYVQSKKIAHYLQRHPLLISLYCSSSKDLHKKVFYETNVASVSKREAMIALTKMHHKESLIKVSNIKDTYQNESLLDLIMDEEQSSAKIFITITDSSNNLPLLEHTSYISEGTNEISIKGCKFEIRLTKGEQEPPKEGTYDWNDRCNYLLNLDQILIKNEELINLFEQDDRLIVQY